MHTACTSDGQSRTVRFLSSRLTIGIETKRRAKNRRKNCGQYAIISFQSPNPNSLNISPFCSFFSLPRDEKQTFISLPKGHKSICCKKFLCTPKNPCFLDKNQTGVSGLSGYIKVRRLVRLCQRR